jgi:hypothetical protein
MCKEEWWLCVCVIGFSFIGKCKEKRCLALVFPLV